MNAVSPATAQDRAAYLRIVEQTKDKPIRRITRTEDIADMARKGRWPEMRSVAWGAVSDAPEIKPTRPTRLEYSRALMAASDASVEAAVRANPMSAIAALAVITGLSRKGVTAILARRPDLFESVAVPRVAGPTGGYMGRVIRLRGEAEIKQ